MANPTLQQTRQQLDDLDGLIQRMLALPLTHLNEAEAESLSRSLRIPPAEFAPSPYPSRQQIVEARIVETPTVQNAGNVVHGWRVEFGGQAPVEEPVRLTTLPPAEDLNVPFASVVIEEVPRPELPELGGPVHSVESTPVLLWPLTLPTRIFDAILGMFPPLAWLRGRFGKLLLGFAGLAMIAAAAVWAYLDWTEFRWTDRDNSPTIVESK